MFNLPKFVLICAWFILVLAFVSFGLGLYATAIEAAICSFGVFIVFSFLE